MMKRLLGFAFAAMFAVSPAISAEIGAPEIKSAGPLAFGPKGILLVGDTVGGAVFAIETGDTEGNPDGVSINVSGLDGKIAAALGTTASEILINDLAVNPANGFVYVSVSRGRGPDATPVIVRVDGAGKITDLPLTKVKFSRAELPNAPAAGGKGRRNKRAQVITDMAYVDGRVLVAGLSNEEFASNLRSIPYPFSEVDRGASVEVFHGAHGRWETRSPVRTLALYTIDNEPHVLAAYTCTPMVKFPLKDLAPGRKVKGVTVAELGNRNRPLDMIVYRSGGKDYVLLANSARGVMKISTENLERAEGITKKISGTAGQKYETIDSLKDVLHLDRLNKGNAVVLVKGGSGLDLKTVALP